MVMMWFSETSRFLLKTLESYVHQNVTLQATSKTLCMAHFR